jgi:hypothetical protein
MTYRTYSTLAALFFAAGALLSLPTGCVTCNSIACASGLQWVAEPEDGSPLAAGDYQLSVTLDGTTYEVTCTVAEPDVGPSECTVAPANGRFAVEVWLNSDNDGVVRGFYLYAVDSSATARTGGLGPETVEITASFAGTPLFAVDHEVEYEVQENYWGDPRCGACEMQESYFYAW